MRDRRAATWFCGSTKWPNSGVRWVILRAASRMRLPVAALRLLILTGQRECEVTDAEWSEFALEAGVWRLPATRTKSGRRRLIHLASEAVAILQALQKKTGKKRPVFVSPLRRNQPNFGRSVNNALGGMFKLGVLGAVTSCHVHALRSSPGCRKHRPAKRAKPGGLCSAKECEATGRR
jgi:integrase